MGRFLRNFVLVLLLSLQICFGYVVEHVAVPKDLQSGYKHLMHALEDVNGKALHGIDFYDCFGQIGSTRFDELSLDSNVSYEECCGGLREVLAVRFPNSRHSEHVFTCRECCRAGVALPASAVWWATVSSGLHGEVVGMRIFYDTIWKDREFMALQVAWERLAEFASPWRSLLGVGSIRTPKYTSGIPADDQEGRATASNFIKCLLLLSPSHRVKRSSAELALFIGVHVGAAVMGIAHTMSHMRFIALEPSPTNFRHFVWNVRLYGLQERIDPINAALGSGADLDMRLNSADMDEVSAGTGDIRVASITMETLLRSRAPSGVHLLVVDCEGCERDIDWVYVRGKLEDALILMVEVHGYHCHLIVSQIVAGRAPLAWELLEQLLSKSCEYWLDLERQCGGTCTELFSG